VILPARTTVLSPHLDDGVFSLGAAIARATRAVARVRVATLFAGDPGWERPAGDWDARTGFRTAGEAVAARRAEDERACALVGARPVWTPLPERAYGGSTDEDVAGALEFLSRAFGFEERLRYTGSEGYVNHAEMRLGDGVIYLGDPGEQYRNPKALGQETVGIYVLVDDVDALYERARAAGAEIREEPTDQEYGDRRFTARDPEGHYWYFAQQIAQVAAEDWGATVTAS